MIARGGTLFVFSQSATGHIAALFTAGVCANSVQLWRPFRVSGKFAGLA
jgi:hypothetical protein